MAPYRADRDVGAATASSEMAVIRVGTASWAIPTGVADRFGEGRSVLERYATRFEAVEINSSFYRPHRPQTYARWAASVPAGFRFAVKVPKAITHERRLEGCETLLAAFLDQVRMLGDKLGPLLIQLPPSLDFDEARAGAFLMMLRGFFEGAIVCEPRHAGWFQPPATRLLVALRVARVAADPAPVAGADEPGGWGGLAYHRLHGSPRIYYSAYGSAFLEGLSGRLAADPSRETWCMFDNTALGAATEDALELARRFAGRPGLPALPYPAR